MATHYRPTLVAAAITSVIAVVIVVSFGRPPTASAVIDLTGEWTFSTAGDVTTVCETVIQHTGDEITGTFDCPAYDGAFQGTVVQEPVGAIMDATLTIYPQGFPDVVWDLVGTVSANGNTFSGDWLADDNDSGTYVGTRHVAVYTVGDLNCDTNVRAVDALTAIRFSVGAEVFQYPDCPVIGVEFASLFGDVDCDDQVDQGDALRILRYAGGLPVPSIPDCADIGSQVTAPN